MAGDRDRARLCDLAPMLMRHSGRCGIPDRLPTAPVRTTLLRRAAAGSERLNCNSGALSRRSRASVRLGRRGYVAPGALLVERDAAACADNSLRRGSGGFHFGDVRDLIDCPTRALDGRLDRATDPRCDLEAAGSRRLRVNVRSARRRITRPLSATLGTATTHARRPRPEAASGSGGPRSPALLLSVHLSSRVTADLPPAALSLSLSPVRSSAIRWRGDPDPLARETSGRSRACWSMSDANRTSTRPSPRVLLPSSRSSGLGARSRSSSGAHLRGPIGHARIQTRAEAARSSLATKPVWPDRCRGVRRWRVAFGARRRPRPRPGSCALRSGRPLRAR
jgi:hypothetical protein